MRHWFYPKNQATMDFCKIRKSTLNHFHCIQKHKFNRAVAIAIAVVFYIHLFCKAGHSEMKGLVIWLQQIQHWVRVQTRFQNHFFLHNFPMFSRNGHTAAAAAAAKNTFMTFAHTRSYINAHNNRLALYRKSYIAVKGLSTFINQRREDDASIIRKRYAE